MWMMIFMSNIEFLINHYDKRRIPYEIRGKEYDKIRKRANRKKELQYLTDELINECEHSKRLRLTPYQKQRVEYLVKKFGNNFKILHNKAKSETIILAFIFYIKINQDPKIKLNHYKITSEYGLTNNVFEIIVCKLAEEYMRMAPLILVESTDYDHEILSKNGGKLK